ncbi:hypothetical protein ACQY74_001675 (plasmid) [Rhizobium leguminosarum bv. trifolii]|jgi:hypothetical protein
MNRMSLSSAGEQAEVGGVHPAHKEIAMARYLGSAHGRPLPPTPDIATRIRTNPRVKAILWSIVICMTVLVVIALFSSHVL